jgi:hypothetical protein
VTIILTEMRLKDKAKIANTEEAALSGLHMSLGNFIRRRFGLWSGNRDLLESCAKAARKDKIHEDEAPALIIREVWKKLRETYSLRAVK